MIKQNQIMKLLILLLLAGVSFSCKTTPPVYLPTRPTLEKLPHEAYAKEYLENIESEKVKAYIKTLQANHRELLLFLLIFVESNPELLIKEGWASGK